MAALKIYIDSFVGSHMAQTRKLIELSKYEKSGKYTLVDSPDRADLILFCDAVFDDYCRQIFQNKILKRFVNKSMILSNLDKPLALLRGIYTSAEKSVFNFGRLRSCSYTAHFDPYKNVFISACSKPIEVEKSLLASFIGRNCNQLRDDLFKVNFSRQDIYLENSTLLFDLYSDNLHRENRQKLYFEKLINSKFSLCPAGFGANSMRLFESMKMGVAPVIISDKWILPKGPHWHTFSLMVREKDIYNLEKVLVKNEHRYKEMGSLAHQAYNQYFSDEQYFDYIIQNCLEIKSGQIIPETFFYFLSQPALILMKFNGRIRNLLYKLRNN